MFRTYLDGDNIRDYCSLSLSLSLLFYPALSVCLLLPVCFTEFNMPHLSYIRNVWIQAIWLVTFGKLPSVKGRRPFCMNWKGWKVCYAYQSANISVWGCVLTKTIKKSSWALHSDLRSFEPQIICFRIFVPCSICFPLESFQRSILLPQRNAFYHSTVVCHRRRMLAWPSLTFPGSGATSLHIDYGWGSLDRTMDPARFTCRHLTVIVYRCCIASTASGQHGMNGYHGFVCVDIPNVSIYCDFFFQRIWSLTYPYNSMFWEPITCNVQVSTYELNMNKFYRVLYACLHILEAIYEFNIKSSTCFACIHEWCMFFYRCLRVQHCQRYGLSIHLQIGF